MGCDCALFIQTLEGLGGRRNEGTWDYVAPLLQIRFFVNWRNTQEPASINV